jgi:integrase
MSDEPITDWRGFMPPPATDITVEEWVELDLAQIGSIGSRSIPDIRLAWKFLTKCLPAGTRLGQLSRLECIAIFKWAGSLCLTEGGPAPRYIGKHRSLLRGSCARAISMGYIEANPFAEWPRGVLPEQVDRENRAAMVLSAEEVSRLISAPTIPFLDRALFCLAVSCGARLGELQAFRFSDIRERTPCCGIVVERSFSTRRQEVGPTKTKASSLTPLRNGNAVSALRRSCKT